MSTTEQPTQSPQRPQGAGRFTSFVDWCIRVGLLVFLAGHGYQAVRPYLIAAWSNSSGPSPAAKQQTPVQLETLQAEAANAISFDKERKGKTIAVQLEGGRIVPTAGGYALLAGGQVQPAAFRIRPFEQSAFATKGIEGRFVVVGVCEGVVKDQAFGERPIILFSSTEFVRTER